MQLKYGKSPNCRDVRNEKAYYTGFVSDTQPYFSPGMNFTRGFYQWEFVRGQLKDRWRSPASVSTERLARYGDPEKLKHNSMVLQYLANTAHVCSEEDTTWLPWWTPGLAISLTN